MTLPAAPPRTVSPMVRDHKIETAQGGYVSVLNPEPASIKRADLGYQLARVVRFGGAWQGARGIGVAQHSIWVCAWLRHKFDSDLLCLHGLLHDAPEAYLGDLYSPLKYIPEIRAAYRPLEDKMEEAIYTALGVPLPLEGGRSWVKCADTHALRVEALFKMASKGQTPEWGEAYEMDESSRHAMREVGMKGWAPALAQKRWDALLDELIGRVKHNGK